MYIIVRNTNRQEADIYWIGPNLTHFGPERIKKKKVAPPDNI